MDNVDDDGVQVRSNLSADGRFELPDPVPMAPPVGYSAPPDLASMIRSMVRAEAFRQAVDKNDFETFEEADDFDIDDDPIDPLTPYEKVFEAPPAKKSEIAVGGKGAGAEGGQPTAAPPSPAVTKSEDSPAAAPVVKNSTLT